MNVGSALHAAKAQLTNPRTVKLGLAVAGGVGLAGVLAACTKTPPKDANRVATDEFGAFDTNGDGQVTLSESNIPHTRRGTRNVEQLRFDMRNGYDMVTGYKQHYEQDYKLSMEKLVRAAGGSDAVVSWQQIADFALKNFDTPDKHGVRDGMLSQKELKAFLKEYGAQEINTGFERITGTTPYTRMEQRWDYYEYNPPRVDRGPRYEPTYPGGRGSGVDPGPRYEPTDPGRGDVDPGPVYEPTR